jgi:hypothetical protein
VITSGTRVVHLVQASTPKFPTARGFLVTWDLASGIDWRKAHWLARIDAEVGGIMVKDGVCNVVGRAGWTADVALPAEDPNAPNDYTLIPNEPENSPTLVAHCLSPHGALVFLDGRDGKSYGVYGRTPDKHFQIRKDARSAPALLRHDPACALAAGINGAGELFLLDLNNFTAGSFTPIGYPAHDLTWSADGRSIAVAHSAGVSVFALDNCSPVSEFYRV